MSKRYFLPMLLILISLLPLFPLLHPGMFAGHDSESHVVRLVAFYQSLAEGNIIPRWAGNLNNGFGHPVLMFLYPLSNYLGSFWHFLGFSFIDSVKLTFALSYVLSGIFMYLFGTEIFGKKAGFFISILYLFAPYRFVDFYVRAALGEHLAFMTMPLVLWSFTKLIKSDHTIYIILSSLSLALLILSHNAISLMFLPFFFSYLIIASIFLSRKSYVLRRISISLFLGFSLSAFFWLPAFVEGKYTLRDIVTKNEYVLHFPDLSSFFYSSWNYGGSQFFSKAVGYGQWLVIIVSMFYLAKNLFLVIPNLFRDLSNKTLKQVQGDKSYRSSAFVFWFILVTIGYFFLTLFLMNKISLPIWQTVTILQKFQFPWRFLSLSVLTSSLLSVGLILLFKKKPYQIVVIIFITVITIISTFSFWQPRGYLKENDDYFKYNYSGTTDTGESSPRWSIRGMEQKAKAPIELIGGEAEVIPEKRTTTQHYYKVNAKNTIQLLDNTVYFPGWEAIADGKPMPIEYQDLNHQGLITFRVPPGIHEVVVQFKETRLRLWADYISLTSLISLFAILVVTYAIRRSRHI